MTKYDIIQERLEAFSAIVDYAHGCCNNPPNIKQISIVLAELMERVVENEQPPQGLEG